MIPVGVGEALHRLAEPASPLGRVGAEDRSQDHVERDVEGELAHREDLARTEAPKCLQRRLAHHLAELGQDLPLEAGHDDAPVASQLAACQTEHAVLAQHAGGAPLGIDAVLIDRGAQNLADQLRTAGHDAEPCRADGEDIAIALRIVPQHGMGIAHVAYRLHEPQRRPRWKMRHGSGSPTG